MALAGAATARATFTAPNVTAATVFSFMVRVADGRSGAATDAVAVTVRPAITAGRVLIAELMINPFGFDADREWVKIHNGAATTVDLSRFALAFGGNTTWGDTTNGAGGVTALSGFLPAGKCLLVGGPTSDRDNANPNLAPPSLFGLGLARTFLGTGLQNPSTGTSAPDAVALFDLPASAVTGSSVPIDIVVYQMTTTGGPSPSRFVGPGGTIAPVSVLAGSDAAAGRSFRRLSVGQWEVSGAVGAADGTAPTPNLCAAVNP